MSHGLALGKNPGIRDERPATNCLGHDTISMFIGQGIKIIMKNKMAVVTTF
jgi:hypothetical protein